jgi:hypothetical protein
MKRKSDIVESTVRAIVREELAGISASVEHDPLHNASEMLSRISVLLNRADEDVNLSLVRESINKLVDLIPEITEEMNIIIDTFSDIDV